MASPSPSPSPSSSPTETLGSKTPEPTHEPDPKTPSTPQSDPNPSTHSHPQPQSKSEQGEGEGEGEGEGQEQGQGEEEEGECGFCLFMKGGGCKDAFIAWEQCVEQAEKSGEDIVDKCFQVTSQLKKCMDAHSDYYDPILRAEEALADSIAEEKDKDVGKEEKGNTESSQ